MKFNTWKMLFVAAAMALSADAFGQGCGCGGGCGSGLNLGTGSDCGREISQDAAASLWADYCYEDCGGQRHGCSLFGRHGRAGCGSACGGGFGQGCFGYPAPCGCGGVSSCGGGCRLLHHHRSGCGGGCPLLNHHHGCHLLSHHRSGCGGGCPLFNHHRSGCGGGCRLFHHHRRGGTFGGGLFSNDCSCGDCFGYFKQPVGVEYGNVGMQSYVSGCLSGCCDSATGYASVPGYTGYAPQAAPVYSGGCNSCGETPVDAAPIDQVPGEVAPVQETPAVEAGEADDSDTASGEVELPPSKPLIPSN